MNRLTMKTLWIATALAMASCGGSAPPEGAHKTEPAKVAVAYFHVDSATAGKLHGRVVYDSDKPARHAIDMTSDAACKDEHGGKPVYDDPLVVGKDKGLANAFVYVKTGLEGKAFEPVKDPVVLDQKGCLFAPRTLGVRAGQPMALRNSDKVSHNVHPVPQNNRE